jgi:hypothetical protein
MKSMGYRLRHGDGKIEHTNPLAAFKQNRDQTKGVKMANNAVEALLKIMDNSELTARRRIEAAEHLLGFEAPADAVERAREYLHSVFNNRDEDLTDRMNALHIVRKSEAAKVTSKIIRLEVKGRSEADRREEWRRYEISQLKRKIYRATGNTPPAGFCNHLMGNDYLPPSGDEWPPWSKKA